VKTLLDEGKFVRGEGACGNAILLANLIKVFFRELTPEPLLNVLGEAEFVKAAAGSAEDFGEVFVGGKMPPSSAAVLLWLLDLALLVVAAKAATSMGKRAIAIVLAPNLWHLESGNPMRGMELMQRAVDFVMKGLSWREEHPTFSLFP
jgi:hypothetical protein